VSIVLKSQFSRGEGQTGSNEGINCFFIQNFKGTEKEILKKIMKSRNRVLKGDLFLFLSPEISLYFFLSLIPILVSHSVTIQGTNNIKKKTTP
jgi:hypothetical protein